MVKKDKPVEDIFSETDKVDQKVAPQAQAVQATKQRAMPKKRIVSKTPLSASANEGSALTPRRRRSMVTMVLLILLVIAILGGGIGWLLRSGILISGNRTDVVSLSNSNELPSTIIDEQDGLANLPTVTIEIVDTDGDGLSDEEEEKLGLNPEQQDSDRDGLYDREEVKVFKTNPLNRDTDGDGNSDGIEVKHGYDPNGTGVLLDLEAGIKSL